MPSSDTQFKPGSEWRGNAGGRPSGRGWTARLREQAEKDLQEGKQLADVLVARLIQIALKGSDSDARQAIKDMWERIDGKVPDVVQMTQTVKEYSVVNDPKKL